MSETDRWQDTAIKIQSHEYTSWGVCSLGFGLWASDYGLQTRTRAAQKIANGFSGEPVPPGFGIGAATSKNSWPQSGILIRSDLGQLAVRRVVAFRCGSRFTTIWRIQKATIPLLASQLD